MDLNVFLAALLAIVASSSAAPAKNSGIIARQDGGSFQDLKLEPRAFPFDGASTSATHETLNQVVINQQTAVLEALNQEVAHHQAAILRPVEQIVPNTNPAVAPLLRIEPESPAPLLPTPMQRVVEERNQDLLQHHLVPENEIRQRMSRLENQLEMNMSPPARKRLIHDYIALNPKKWPLAIKDLVDKYTLRHRLPQDSQASKLVWHTITEDFISILTDAKQQVTTGEVEHLLQAVQRNSREKVKQKIALDMAVRSESRAQAEFKEWLSKAAQRESNIRAAQIELFSNFVETKTQSIVAQRKQLAQALQKETQAQAAQGEVSMESAIREAQIRTAQNELMLQAAQEKANLQTAKREALLHAAQREAKILATQRKMGLESAKREAKIQTLQREMSLQAAQREGNIRTAEINLTLMDTKRETRIETARRIMRQLAASPYYRPPH